MGLLGKYIDALSDEQKDRVIEAQEWCNGGLWDGNAGRCLVGHAEDIVNDLDVSEETWERLCRFKRGWWGVGDVFDALCRRYGQQRVIAWVKARAAKPQPAVTKTIDPAPIAN